MKICSVLWHDSGPRVLCMKGVELGSRDLIGCLGVSVALFKRDGRRDAWWVSGSLLIPWMVWCMLTELGDAPR